jgi:hypothetical protein
MREKVLGKAVKATFRKVMWVGKATTFLVGLAVVVGLTAGLASSALAANGNSFILGKLTNAATAVTRLTGNVAGPTMQFRNPNTAANARALDLLVDSGNAPLTVSASAGKALNLNADKLDGKDSSEFASASSAPLWAHVNSNGTLVRGNGVNFSGRFSTGYYHVSFDRDVSFCGYVATTTDTYAGTTGTLQGASYGFPGEVTVFTLAGTERADLPFHLVVTC